MLSVPLISVITVEIAAFLLALHFVKLSKLHLCLIKIHCLVFCGLCLFLDYRCWSIVFFVLGLGRMSSVRARMLLFLM